MSVSGKPRKDADLEIGHHASPLRGIIGTCKPVIDAASNAFATVPLFFITQTQ